MRQIKSRNGAFCILVALATIVANPAFANNVGENGAWQFQTTADKANRAFIEDMRQKKANGYYASPIYTTNIDRQYNCSLSSVSTGNQGTSTSIGNSPSSSGHATNATGNADSATIAQSAAATGSVSASQQTDGEIEAGASGNVSTGVDGNTYQTLNTDQRNTGDQASAVTGSNACQFGFLN
jgi:hypothetical protein